MDNKGKINRFVFRDDDEHELVPLMSEEIKVDDRDIEVPSNLPILPLKNAVLFPGVVIPLSIGREQSLQLVKDVYDTKDKVFGALAQKRSDVTSPKYNDLHKVGTVGRIIKVLEMLDDSTTIIVQGEEPFYLTELTSEEPYLIGKIAIREDASPMVEEDENFQGLISSIRESALKILKANPNVAQEAAFAIKNIEDSTFLINFICNNIDIDLKQKQKCLECGSLHLRAKSLLKALSDVWQKLKIQQDIQKKVHKEMDQQQREYYLQQQIKTIQDELGGTPNEQDVKELQKKSSKKKWTKEVNKYFKRELNKFQNMNPASGEYSVQFNYLNTLVDLPWGEYSKDNFNLSSAKKQLDKDHSGLDKVKERVLEHLAVVSMKGDLKAPILCFYGPPGVGKTSLGQSIAKATGKKYTRMSLGGLHDEAEIRGHRRTYIGAMPGRIIQAIKKAGTSNPVVILDEIDKLASSFHGDPSSALLEVLDPEQNHSFHDNFLDIDYDLSKVMFIATANTLSTLQPALLDRLEVIDVNGYVQEEKVDIAKKHLLPKQLAAHGLSKSDISISKPVFNYIVSNYTLESGVRQLDKQLATLCRKITKKKALKETYPSTLKTNDVKELLGISKVSHEKYQGNNIIGVVTGLAWTSAGGEILFIESSLNNSKSPNLTLTGNLGEVMKESAIIALEYIKSHAKKLKIDPEVFEETSVHIHVPEGAIPKDGPSAGITMVTSLTSSFTKRKVKKGLAMTGEMTLRGKVMPVGGIQEKVLAAKRAGIQEIILCKENEKDILEIKKDYLEGLSFTYVSDIMEVLKMALV